MYMERKASDEGGYVLGYREFALPSVSNSLRSSRRVLFLPPLSLISLTSLPRPLFLLNARTHRSTLSPPSSYQHSVPKNSLASTVYSSSTNPIPTSSKLPSLFRRRSSTYPTSKTQTPTQRTMKREGLQAEEVGRLGREAVVARSSTRR